MDMPPAFERDIPHRGSRHMALTHSYDNDLNPSDRYRGSNRALNRSLTSPSSPSSVPMPIPHMREEPPPPLPPPRHLADIEGGGHNGPDLAWQWENSRVSNEWGGSSVTPGSSLYGSMASSRAGMSGNAPEPARRTSSTSTIKSLHGAEAKEAPFRKLDEGYSSLSSASIDSYSSSTYSNPSSAKSGFQSSVHDQYRSNAQAYDKSLLQKLDPRRGSESTTPPRKFSLSSFSSSIDSPTSRIAYEHRHPPQLKALSLPIITSKPNLAESPLARWTETPTAISPGHPYSRPGAQELRSPREVSDYERTRVRPRGPGSVASIGDDSSTVASVDSYGQRISPEHDTDFQMEETGFRRLHITDYNGRPEPFSPGVTAGQKRRAESPLGEDGQALHGRSSVGDLYSQSRRREPSSRTSPNPRYQSLPGSINSNTSGYRTNSYASTPSLAGSSMTSMNSYDRLSPPGGLSPVPTDGSESPYVTSLSLNPSPRGSISRTNHGRALSDTRNLVSSRKLPDNASNPSQGGGPKMQGGFICECCPKKPKKFDTQEELTAHEQEKQYECAYCRNRFKNKNEAERHQNSLHLRRHSWSCAALSGYAAAFHNSPSRPNEADACGYCGDEFLRTGVSSPTAGGHRVAVATEQDWEIRIVHLQEMHKFRECNHAKKFFRADHFRQHLKHSHAGTSGKWTNMLENACMKDEPLPEPIRGRDRVSPVNGRVARIEEEEAS